MVRDLFNKLTRSTVAIYFKELHFSTSLIPSNETDGTVVVEGGGENFYFSGDFYLQRILFYKIGDAPIISGLDEKVLSKPIWGKDPISDSVVN